MTEAFIGIDVACAKRASLHGDVNRGRAGRGAGDGGAEDVRAGSERPAGRVGMADDSPRFSVYVPDDLRGGRVDHGGQRERRL